MRFTLRDMMLFTAVVLLCVGWSVDRARLAKRNAELQFQLSSSRSLLDKSGWTTTVDRQGVVFARRDGAGAQLEQEVRGAIAKPKELGAPQPLPSGLGDAPQR